MRDVRLGVTLPQFTGDPERFSGGALRAEALGFDSVWVFDHLWPLSGSKQRPILEAWTSLAWVAERTERVAVGTLVTRSSLREPAVLVNMARTVARIAPGRLLLGVGSGDDESRAENEAFGLPYWAGADRVKQFEDTVAMLKEELEGFGVKLWIAGRSDDAISIAARYGDAWNGWSGTAEAFARDAATLASYAGDRAVEPTWGGVLRPEAQDEAAATLSAMVEAGARHLVCTIPEAWRRGRYERLARDVAPAAGLR